MLPLTFLALFVTGVPGASVNRRQVGPNCPQACFAVYQPVCASDHQTYSNKCTFEVSLCEMQAKGQTMHIVHEGSCEGTLRQKVNRRQVSSNCPQDCSAVYQPVCASNHHTYSNRCAFDIALCELRLKGGTMHLVHEGSCGSSVGGVVTNNNCDAICDEDLHHVCGSDGVVYQNLCLFQRAQCEAARNGTRLTLVAYNDTCPKPRAPDCEQYNIDTSDLALENGVHVHSACPRTTTASYVCGTDGRTYANECSLCQHMEVFQDGNIMVLHDGYCRSSLVVG